jgi:hypothetical protein
VASMPPRRPGASGASFEVLRAAVARRVAETSGRQTAREIGLSYQALTRFIRGTERVYRREDTDLVFWRGERVGQASTGERGVTEGAGGARGEAF